MSDGAISFYLANMKLPPSTPQATNPISKNQSTATITTTASRRKSKKSEGDRDPPDTPLATTTTTTTTPTKQTFLSFIDCYDVGSSLSIDMETTASDSNECQKFSEIKQPTQSSGHNLGAIVSSFMLGPGPPPPKDKYQPLKKSLPTKTPYAAPATRPPGVAERTTPRGGATYHSPPGISPEDGARGASYRHPNAQTTGHLPKDKRQEPTKTRWPAQVSGYSLETLVSGFMPGPGPPPPKDKYQPLKESLLKKAPYAAQATRPPPPGVAEGATPRGGATYHSSPGIPPEDGARGTVYRHPNAQTTGHLLKDKRQEPTEIRQPAQVSGHSLEALVSSFLPGAGPPPPKDKYQLLKEDFC